MSSTLGLMLERPEVGAGVVQSPADPVVDAVALPRLSAQTAHVLGRWQAVRDFQSAVPLLVTDVFAIVSAIVSVVVVSAAWTLTPIFQNGWFDGGVVLLVVLFNRIHGLYPACGMSHSLEYRCLLRTCLMVSAAVTVGFLLQHEMRTFPIIGILTFAAVLAFYLTVFRSLARRFLSMFDWWTQPVAIIGTGKEACHAFERLLKCGSEGLRPVGIIYDPSEHWDAAEEMGVPFLGPISELAQILIENRTCRVAVTERKKSAWQQYHGFHGIPHVMLPTDLGYHPIEKARLAESDGNIQLHCRINLTNPVSLASKRALDLVLVIGLMVFWLPVCVLIAICIKCLDPGPIFYHQARVGRFRKPFNAIKFRSMVTDADLKLREYLDVHPELQAEWEDTHKLKNDPRITKFGEFLRKTSLDELPQLFNVLQGQMSLVGPRPIIDCGNYDREYIQNHPEVFELYQMVRPGITGLWQVSGRNALPYHQRVHLDRCYLHNWSVTLDIFILWKTIKTAVLREGAF